MDMANRCVSSWSPHGAAWFYSPTGATFENDALASALARAYSVSPSPSMSPTPSTSTTTTTSSASELSYSVVLHDAPSRPLGRAAPVDASEARPPQARRRTSTGRVISKRKPRPSRRAAVTYITANPANFSRMVQEITGFQLVPGAERGCEAAEAPPAPSRRAPDSLAFVLPTLDTSASFSLDRMTAPPEKDGTLDRVATTPSTADDWSLLLMQELEAPAVASAFPTLESWGMM